MSSSLSHFRIFFLAFFFPYLLFSESYSTGVSESILKIESIQSDYFLTEKFQRISEFFTGRENPGNRLILRTEKEARDGFYFILTLNQPLCKISPQSTFILEYITQESPETKIRLFPLEDVSLPRSSELYLGLTGEDWPSQDIQMVAWKISFIDAHNQRITSRQSFLWQYPSRQNP